MTEGIDVYEGNGAVDWGRTGKAFAFIKAFQAGYGPDSRFAANIAGATGAGILPLPYCYVVPSIPPMRDQAAALLARLGEVGGIKEDWGLMADWEDDSGIDLHADLLAGALDFHGTIFRALGIKSWLYSNHDYLSRHNLIGHPELAAVANLHLADWTTIPPAPIDPWGVARMWQYSDTGSVPGVVGPCDLDRFAGTIDELRALGWGYIPDPLQGQPTDPPPDVATNSQGEATDVNAAAQAISKHALSAYYLVSTAVALPLPPQLRQACDLIMLAKSDADAIARVSGLLS
jgi:GH25 family lysozyme M1 (1,4-beta-N-acetylmuramidase)